MKSLFILILLCAGCASSPQHIVHEAPPKPCPELPPPPTCEDKVMVMDEKGVTCPSNTRATFPSPFGYFQPGKVIVLCQCK